MTKIQIPHDAIVFVADGCKALFLRNEGDEEFPNLKTETVFLDHNPPTGEQGTDKPGRSYATIGPGRSAFEPTDWHDLEKHFCALRGERTRETVTRAPSEGAADRRAAAHARGPAPGAAQGCQSPHHCRSRQGFHKQPVYEIEKHLAG
jgi:hypothetical protein